jgi:hypothetical protein
MSGRSVTLVVPGLLGPLPAEAGPDTPAPALERLLARSHRRSLPAHGLCATLFHLFGHLAPPEADLPSAAVTRLADTGETAPGWWLRADPVHLRADRDRLLLFEHHTFHPTAEEAQTLAQAFNAQFAADGLALEAVQPQRWYLRADSPPRLRTSELAEAVGRDIHDFLPRGSDGRPWQALLNEVQMLFHGSPVNQAREAAGRPEINSVWFWGGGALPKAPASPWVQVWAEEPLARGLAALAGTPTAFLPASGLAWLEQAVGIGEHLAVLEDAWVAALYGDVSGWGESVAALDSHWFAPLAAALARGELQRLSIVPADGRWYSASRRALWRFWQRRRPITTWCQSRQ